MSSPRAYPVQIFWSEEDEGYIALAPDLPGCSAFGHDQEEALTELQDAIAAWIMAAEASGNPIPEPGRPADKPRFGGRLLVRMPRSLHEALSRRAELEGVSLNQLAVTHLTWAEATARAGESNPDQIRKPVQAAE